VEWYRCLSAARVASRAAEVCRVCSRARRRSRHRLNHRESLAFTMLTFPCSRKSHGEPGWPRRCSACGPRLVMPVSVSAQAQSGVSSVRPRSEADTIVNAAKHINRFGGHLGDTALMRKPDARRPAQPAVFPYWRERATLPGGHPLAVGHPPGSGPALADGERMKPHLRQTPTVALLHFPGPSLSLRPRRRQKKVALSAWELHQSSPLCYVTCGRASL
jgi:hypothetical protein